MILKRRLIQISILVLLLIFSQCKSKKQETSSNQSAAETASEIDTIYIHDTVVSHQPQQFLYLEKMQVLYVGVDNPISVQVAGLSPADIEVKGLEGVSVKEVSVGRYVATVAKPGEVQISVAGPGIGRIYIFRVKRIPDPVARLSNKTGGLMGNGEFKAQGGVAAFLDNFDFDATCAIVGFELTYIAKRSEPITVTNSGPRYTNKSRELVNRAKPGDTYIFTYIKAKCPGDEVVRNINSMAFMIR